MNKLNYKIKNSRVQIIYFDKQKKKKIIEYYKRKMYSLIKKRIIEYQFVIEKRIIQKNILKKLMRYSNLDESTFRIDVNDYNKMKKAIQNIKTITGKMEEILSKFNQKGIKEGIKRLELLLKQINQQINSVSNKIEASSSAEDEVIELLEKMNEGLKGKIKKQNVKLDKLQNNEMIYINIIKEIYFGGYSIEKIKEIIEKNINLIDENFFK